MSEVERFLTEAVRLAEQSVAEGGGPFAALVVRDGEVVGQGYNRVTESLDPTAHAEVQAIREACRRLGTYRLDGCALYVSCEPCPMCAAAAYWARLDGVWYAAPADVAAAAGFDDIYIRRELLLEPAARALPFHHRAVPGAGRPFRRWETKADRVDY